LAIFGLLIQEMALQVGIDKRPCAQAKPLSANLTLPDWGEFARGPDPLHPDKTKSGRNTIDVSVGSCDGMGKLLDGATLAEYSSPKLCAPLTTT
jgi:hypothetical protein